MAKKSLETGEDIDSIPESMRAYLAMQAMESGKGFPGAFLGRGMMPYGQSSMLMPGEQGGPSKVCKCTTRWKMHRKRRLVSICEPWPY